jgi:hypothetical protein
MAKAKPVSDCGTETGEAWAIYPRHHQLKA